MIRRVPPNPAFRDRLAFSRAVEAGGLVFISATAATDEAGALVSADPAEQTRDIFAQMEAALAELDLSLTDIVRLRIYLADYAYLDAILSVQHPLFDVAPPACAVVNVPGFHVPGIHVYIEGEAIRPAN